MAFAIPRNSKNQINKAGEILKAPLTTASETTWAFEVLSNWRASHGYPINTFQATLRQKLKSVDKNAIVAQRMKRTPSVILKLKRFNGMKLARMQDIGGLRAVVGSVKRVRHLENNYRSSRFKHELVSSKDYIEFPKEDGYRSVHLIYKYFNPIAPEYNGLHLELQFRSKLQHAWATAVETMGTYLDQALKSGQGEKHWRDYFKICSAIFALQEGTNPVPGFDGIDQNSLAKALKKQEGKLGVCLKLRAFAVATDAIYKQKGRGKYHLVKLNLDQKTVSIKPFAENQLELANKKYAEYEKRAQSGENIETVLVSAGPISELRKAYPNYFLDTQDFVKRITKIIKAV